MEAKFKIGETLLIVGGLDELNIDKEVIVIDTFHYVRKSRVNESAVDNWEYKVTDGIKSLGWITEYHLEPLNRHSIQ